MAKCLTEVAMSACREAIRFSAGMAIHAIINGRALRDAKL